MDNEKYNNDENVITREVRLQYIYRLLPQGNVRGGEEKGCGGDKAFKLSEREEEGAAYTSATVNPAAEDESHNHYH